MTDSADRFDSTARYYAAYRPGYGDAAPDYLADRFGLGAESRVLDLGCGAGQLTVPLARRTGEVVAMDPSESMLSEARRAVDDAGLGNVTFVHGGDTDLHDGMGPFRLTTMGRSFHWMDQRAVLDRLRRLTEAGGGVALVTGREWLAKGTEDWGDAVYDVVGDHLDGAASDDLPERRDPAEVEYDQSWVDLLDEEGFRDATEATFAVDREWSVDQVVGYVFSLSYASPARFGDGRDAFEAALRDRLAGFDEPFAWTETVEVVSGFVGQRA